MRASDYLPFSPLVRSNPYPYYHVLREEAPVYRLEPLFGAYVVSRYADTLAALKNYDHFSSKALDIDAMLAQASGRDELQMSGARNLLMTSDPPIHTRLRSMVSRAFTPRRVTDLEPRIREVAGELIEAMLAKDEFDFVTDLAAPLSITLIAELLGVEHERLHDFTRWSEDLSVSVATAFSGARVDQAASGVLEFHDYLQTIIERRRREPRNDLISTLIQEGEREDILSSHDILLFCRLLLVAGHTPTINMLGNGMLAMLNHQAEWKRLVANPSLVSSAIEEVLRFEAPIQSVLRKTTAEVKIADQDLPPGTLVLLLLGSANRDPRKFQDPDRFDITRDTLGHLGLGHGIHFCLGAAMARLEGVVVLEELIKRAHRLPFISSQPESLEWNEFFVLRGLKSLRLRNHGHKTNRLGVDEPLQPVI